MRTAYLVASLFTLVPALAAAERLADHPAIAVQRLHAQQGYDYASKFYPHPAWLYLLPEAPHRMNDHPAVTIARQRAETHAKAVADARVLLADQARQ